MIKKEFEGKKLLVLGGITLACDIVRQAQKMGAHVIVADYNEDSPAKAIADQAELINATDVRALVDFCRKEKVDGVTTGFIDILMPICYEVCKELNLPYYATPKMLSMATNKIDFKETCMEHGVPVPQTYVLGNKIPADVLDNINYPVFVKPLDASGSRGAGVCYDKEQLLSQFEEALSFSSTKNAIVEDYITGREFLLDYIGVNGEFRLFSMFDRYVCSDRGSAINYSNVCLAPAGEIDYYLDEINGKVISMFQKLGFKDGLIFLQGHTDGKKVTFYEMGSRLGGSFYNLQRACIGRDALEMTVRYALTGKMVDDIDNIPVDVSKYEKTAMVCNFLLDGDDETIAGIEGIDKIAAMPECSAYIQRQQVGDSYKKDRTVDKPVLNAYFTCDSKDDAKRVLGYVNEVFSVTNKNGKSLLKEKYSPENL